MSVFKLTPEGDIKRDAFGMPPRVDGVNEAVQNVSTLLKIIKGEVFRDITKGLNSFGFIFEPQTSGRQISNHVADLIGSVPGIIEPEVQLSYATDGTGELTIDWQAFYSPDDQRDRTKVQATLVVTNFFGEAA